MRGSLRMCLVLLVCFLVSFSGTAQQVTQEQLIGDWVFNYEVSLELMDEAARSHYEQMDANGVANLEQAYQGRRLVFGPAGYFSQELSDGQQVEALWSLDTAGDIEIVSPSGQVINFRVLEIAEDHIILIPKKPDNSMANMLFSQWYLMKG